MTVLPGKTTGSAESRKKLAEQATDELRDGVLVVGPEAVLLKATVQKNCEDRRVESADSILEAVLMAGGTIEEPGGDVGVILAGVSQELDQIEPAVRSLRKVYPSARIILLCDSGDEVVCRKAKGWGADDYLLLPVDGDALRRAMEMKRVETKIKTAEPEQHENGNGHAKAAGGRIGRLAPAELLHEVVEVAANGKAEINGDAKIEKRIWKKEEGCGAGMLALPGLPLMVQTVLLNDLLAGRTDFAERAVATLQSYGQMGGTLRFISAESESAPEGDVRATVQVVGQAPFGTLVLDVRKGGDSVSASVQLSQAAQWLAAMLSVSRRYEQLRSLAITDELSGAYNRRYFMKWMSGLLERARVKRFRVTLMMFDIDDFKQYNDKFGHASGDAIIRELIKLLRTCSRSHDLVARLGGDEFAVVYWDNEAPRQPNSEHPKDALVATERFRKAIKEHHWADSCKIKGEVSISGGLATFPWDADSLESLMEKADEALLRAKGSGKNVIVMQEGKDCGKENTD